MASGIPCYKVILVGEYGVGKSSIFRRFVNNTFLEEDSKTNGRKSQVQMDNHTRVFYANSRVVKIELWDTAGVERFSTLSSSYYTKAVAVIVCFSYDNKDSFNTAAQHIFDAIEQSEAALIYLCGNKVDKTLMTHDDDAADDTTDDDATDDDAPCGDAFVQRHDIGYLLAQFGDIIKRTFLISCKTGEGFDDMFNEIARMLLHRLDKKEQTKRILLSTSNANTKGCCST